MLIYGISLLIVLFERSETRKNKNTIIKDLASSPTEYALNQDNFGLSHLFILDPIVPFVDESYFNIRYIQTNETLIPGNETYERFRYGHSLCGDDFPFTSSEFLNRTDYISYLQCPETQSYEVSGTRTSQTYKYVLIKLSK